MRVDNAIAYVSPTWSGFKGGIAYSFNVSGAEVPGGGNNTRLLDMGLSWTWGNLYLVTTYDIVYLPNCTGGTTSSTSSTICGGADQTHWQIGGTYDFKFVKLHAAYAMEKNQRAFSTVGTLPNIQDGFDSNSWMLGVTVPLFGGQVLASYQQRDGDERALNALQKFEADLSVWAIAYTYPLSRRTNLYINYSDKSGEKSLANTSTLSSGLGGDRSQFTVGMRHLF
jgi:predicted porin